MSTSDEPSPDMLTTKFIESPMSATLTPVSSQSEYFGPNNFAWLWHGKLGGMPRPGIVLPIESDLEALVRVGVRALFTLTAEWEPPKALIERYGIESLYLPIEDMGVPTLRQADATCALVNKMIACNYPVAFHCRAGKGRTGTMLAAQMIWSEPDHATAISYVRSINRNWIESAAQMEFLEVYAAHRAAKVHVV